MYATCFDIFYIVILRQILLINVFDICIIIRYSMFLLFLFIMTVYVYILAHGRR